MNAAEAHELYLRSILPHNNKLFETNANQSSRDRGGTKAMSGGSYDYAYWKIEELAEQLRHTETDPRRATLKRVLVLLTKAMHDVEWVDSADYGEGDDHKALDELFGMLGADPAIVTKAAAYDALREQLTEFFKIKEEESYAKT